MKIQDSSHLTGDPLGATDVVMHRIQTTDDVPVFKKQYRLPPEHRAEIDRQIKDLEGKGIIKP